MVQTPCPKCTVISHRTNRFRQELQSRVSVGTVATLAVEWALMPLFAPPNPNYGMSLEKAREKVCLKVFAQYH
jgi:hypothetical protein